jgi:hypothetical protein
MVRLRRCGPAAVCVCTARGAPCAPGAVPAAPPAPLSVWVGGAPCGNVSFAAVTGGAAGEYVAVCRAPPGAGGLADVKVEVRPPRRGTLAQRV